MFQGNIDGEKQNDNKEIFFEKAKKIQIFVFFSKFQTENNN